MMYQNKTFAWTPQLGTQTLAITAKWCEELFFGGARGGGKTSYLLGDYAQDIKKYGSAWKGILFRRTYPELEEVIFQSQQIFPKMGGAYKLGSRTWHFPNGATFKLRSMDREQDADKFQGSAYCWIGFDELPNWATDVAFNKLKACLRSTEEVPAKRIRATGNPGGVGHSWVKHRFIDPNPEGLVPIDEIKWVNTFTGEQSQEPRKGANWFKSKSTRMFIPSRLQDNQILMNNDPHYVTRLSNTGSAELVRAWLAGDWNAIQGAYFDDWNQEKHIIEPFEIPQHWYKIRSMDWGYAKPFSIHWWAVSDGSDIRDYDGNIISFPKGAMICYREYYGMQENKPDVGKRKNIDEISKEILRKEQEKVNNMVLDPACWKEEGGESIVEQFSNNGVFFLRADNARIPGWQQVRYRLKNNLLFFFKHCKHIIRTIPIQQHDEHHYEDLDTKLEDHAVDDMRYACMSRPISIPRAIEQEPPRAFPTGKELLEEALKSTEKWRKR